MDDSAGRRHWESMRLVRAGSIDEVIQGGVAKTGSSQDPGDPGKPPSKQDSDV